MNTLSYGNLHGIQILIVNTLSWRNLHGTQIVRCCEHNKLGEPTLYTNFGCDDTAWVWGNLHGIEILVVNTLSWGKPTRYTNPGCEHTELGGSLHGIQILVVNTLSWGEAYTVYKSWLWTHWVGGKPTRYTNPGCEHTELGGSLHGIQILVVNTLSWGEAYTVYTSCHNYLCTWSISPRFHNGALEMTQSVSWVRLWSVYWLSISFYMHMYKYLYIMFTE